MAAMLQTLRNDVRYAVRLLRRSPGFAGATILTLALSIGANAAIYSAVQGVLISPLPYPEPERLVRLFEEAPATSHFPMAPADFRDYRAELQTFEGLAAYLRADLQLGDAARPEHLRGMQVTAGFFRLLGYQPLFGREFELDDELPGRNEVVVLSHGLWMRRFDGDASIIGRSVRLSGRTFRVVGVLPPDFQHVGGTYRTYGHGETIDIWSVLPVPREERPGLRFSHYFNVVGRIRSGVSRGEMEQDLKRTGVSVAKRYPNPNSPWSPSAVPLKQEIVGTAESTLLVLAGAAAAVLLLACVNVAGLLLGRASSRSREIGVRAALGATRWRLARQMLVESVVLAAAGGVIGIGLAYGAIAALTRFGPSDLPRLQAIAIDGHVLGSAVAVIVFCALAFGFAPAWRLARAGVSDALRDGGRSVAGDSHQRTRRLLVAAEVALAFVLIVSSGLLLRSFIRMMNADPGFEPGRAITVSVDLPTARYDTPASTAFYQRAADRVRALPGVAEVAFSSDLPWTGYDENTGFSIVGRQFPPGDGPEARYHFITHGYTRATGTPVVAGRDFSPGDGPDAPLVVLINESAARKYWKSADAAVGARMNVWGSERTVAGVIGDVRDMPWHDRAVPALYFPQPQRWYPQPMFLIARTQVDPSAVVESIRGAFREIDAELPLASVRPLDSVASAAIATRRLTLWLVAIFGFTAVVLAVVGVYGVIAQAVAQRTHEFGIRQALGATRGDILRLVMVSGAAMTIAGLVDRSRAGRGVHAAPGSLLYGVAPFDPAHLRRRCGHSGRGIGRRDLPSGAPRDANQRGGRPSRRR